jgi:hypothetical protein
MFRLRVRLYVFKACELGPLSSALSSLGFVSELSVAASWASVIVAACDSGATAAQDHQKSPPWHQGRKWMGWRESPVPGRHHSQGWRFRRVWQLAFIDLAFGGGALDLHQQAQLGSHLAAGGEFALDDGLSVVAGGVGGRIVRGVRFADVPLAFRLS